MKLLTTKEAGEYLGYTEQTMRTARSRGELAGMEPPKHIKFSRKSVRYDPRVLEQWMIDAQENAASQDLSVCKKKGG